jgi:cytochrome d ubiquinol oxidase subunit I
MLKMGLGMAVILAPLQAYIGDAQGLQAAEVQPAKIAAIEAHWEGTEVAPLVLFAIPDEESERNLFEISIPKGASLLITHTLDGLFPGLKDFAPEDRPPVWGPFYGFRLMVGIGIVMIVMSIWGVVQWARGRLEQSRRFLILASWTWSLGFIAIIAGWTVAEVGRQPWVATGILRTVDARSPVPAEAVLTTLILFVVVYLVIFVTGIVYINRLIRNGPTPEAAAPAGVANRPLTAAVTAGAGAADQRGG